MSERKYTYEQIVKALECCINADCLNCPRWSEEWYSGMCNDFLKSVLALINRQKAEIEKWKKNCDELYGQMSERQKAEVEIARRMGKADAINEFAERLKANMCHGYPYLEIEEDLFRRDVDNLVAEMTEGE